MLPVQMALVKTEVNQEVVDYLARHARSDAVLERVARETAEMPCAEMATTPDEAALLTMLARLVGARRALELGTFTGYGAISIARRLDDGGRLTCLEVEEEYAANRSPEPRGRRRRGTSGDHRRPGPGVAARDAGRADLRLRLPRRG